MPKKNPDQLVTWQELNMGFYLFVAALGLIVGAVIAFYVQQARIDVLTQRVTVSEKAYDELKSDVRDIKSTGDQAAKDIVEIKALLRLQAGLPKEQRKDAGSLSAITPASDSHIISVNKTPQDADNSAELRTDEPEQTQRPQPINSLFDNLPILGR